DRALDVSTPKLCRKFQAGQNGVYTLRTQRFGCSEALAYTLTLYPVPQIRLFGNTVGDHLCLGDNLAFEYHTGLPVTEKPQFDLTLDGQPLSGSQGSGDVYLYGKTDVRKSDEGQYILKVTTANQCTASDTANVFIDEPVAVHIILDADTGCEDGEEWLTVYPNVPDYGYKWYNASRTIAEGQSSVMIRWQRTDNGPLFLEVTQNACISADTVDITVIPLPHLKDMPKDTNICAGQTLCLRPVSDMVPTSQALVWINKDGRISQTATSDLYHCLEDVDASMNGRYFFIAMNAAGSKTCSSLSDTTEVTVQKTPDIFIDGPEFICDGSSVMLKAVSYTAGTVRWHHDNSTDDIIHVSAPGLYEVTRISEYGCENTAELYLEAHTLPHFSLPPDTSICRGASFMIYGPDNME
ncbi:MAG: hypothetical protein K2H65_05295, partial [Bacteroidales bacterium]|nr:hypothetical protein [Bacteroidales bacterium]